MKFVIFGDNRRVGVIVGDRVLDLLRGADVVGISDAPAKTLLELIEAGERGLDIARSIADRAAGSDAPGLSTPLAAAKLHAPWPGMRLALAGMNNADHVAHCYTNMGEPTTAAQFREAARKGKAGAYFATALPVMGPDAEIRIPSHAKGYFDYEGEPAIVLGKRGHDIKARDIEDYVWGVTQVIDWSVRDDTWPAPPPKGLLFPSKNFDCSKSVGPCIAVGETKFDDFQIETWVNGERRQSFNSKEMIFSFGEILEVLSPDFTLHPGDIVSGGTGPGTAIDSSVRNADGTIPTDRYLKPGDVVEVRSAVGSLSGRCVAKPA